MSRPLKMKNAIQPYAWGSLTALAELLGEPSPSNQPQAELWMGAHPKAPSQIWYQGRWQSLEEMIRREPVVFLGKIAASRFGTQLPYLFKVLAVDQPLSIQAHPDKKMAERGFARENEQGISLTAPHRNYRDDNHKPECVCALTPFTALCGFRPVGEMRVLLDPLWPRHRRDELPTLAGGEGNDALKSFFNHLMRLSKESRRELTGHLVEAALHARENEPAYDWMVRLDNAYPGDIGVLGPCMLHLVTLQPGQALFLASGKLHAYLQGVAIELMANSDNVLRGGLTPKHVDIDELLNVLSFGASALDILEPERIGGHLRRYPSMADEFELEALSIDASSPYDTGNRPNAPVIILCIDGTAEISWEGSDSFIGLRKGESIFVPAEVDRYAISGRAEIYKAGINHRIVGTTS